jgi:hypothetical protein
MRSFARTKPLSGLFAMIGSEQTVRRDAKRQDWQLTDTSDFRNPVDRVICAKDLPYGEKFRLRRSPEILHTVPRPSDEGPTLNFIYFRNTRAMVQE